MERRVKLSIRAKIIGVVSTLVLASLGLYLFVALGLFNSDKTAYIFESGLNNAETVSTQVRSFFGRIVKDSLNIYNVLASRDFQPVEVRQPLPVSRFRRAPEHDRRAAVRNIIRKLESRRRPDGESPSWRLRARLARFYVELGSLHESRTRRSYQRKLSQWKKKGRRGSAPRPDLQEAQINYEKALETLAGVPEPKDGQKHEVLAEAYFAKGKALERMARFTEARTSYRQAFSLRPSEKPSAKWSFRLAETLYRRTDFNSALEHYKQALKSGVPGQRAYARYKLAWSYRNLERSQKAMAHYRRLLTDKDLRLEKAVRSRVMLEAANVFAEGGRVGKAQRFFSRLPGGAPFVQKTKAIAQRLRSRKGRGKGVSELQERRLLRSLFYGDPDMVEFSVYRKKGARTVRLVRLANEKYLEENGVGRDYLNRVDSERPVPFERVTAERPVLQNSSLKGGVGLLTLVRQDPRTGRFLVVRVTLDRFLDFFTQNRVYTTYLVGQGGDLYGHSAASELTRNRNMLQEDFVVDAVKSEVGSGVKERTRRDGTEVIVAFTEVGLFDLFVFSEIEREKAFLAAKKLTVKSIYFGVFIIALAIIIGVIFAKTLTGPIDKLFQGTKVIAGGDFKTRVDVTANDEIGALADSFNFMAGRIVSLLEEEKDKVRMQEELKVAKLVQDSFFPADRMAVGALDIAAFYTPSSECGGDWWTCVRHGDKVLLLIGDATGHGVPAALITATASSCVTTVREMAQRTPELLDSPAAVLGVLNKAVYAAAQGQILMTFFAALIDPNTGEITYSNASHNPPYLYKHKEKDPQKRDLKPLMEAVGKRLGHEFESTYEDTTAEMSPNDVIVFFTDGLIECTNPEQQEYGNRKFLKSILNNVKKETPEIRDGIVQSAMDFYNGQPLDDDLTMVITKLLPEARSEAPDPSVA